MRISDWSSDVCSSDLPAAAASHRRPGRTLDGHGSPLPGRGTWDNGLGGVGQAVASSERVPRKVRAPQGTVPGNAWAARADGKCNRKQTAERSFGARGKGEMVR